jgi:hypothetical protein
MSASGVQAVRRIFGSMRISCSSSPLRSSRCASDERQLARTWSKSGNAAAAVQRHGRQPNRAASESQKPVAKVVEAENRHTEVDSGCRIQAAVMVASMRSTRYFRGLSAVDLQPTLPKSEGMPGKVIKARPRTRRFGASPYISGAYIASTRVGGIWN